MGLVENHHQLVNCLVNFHQEADATRIADAPYILR